jgi:hypothetical protein
MAGAEIDIDALLRYVRVLENAILISASELRCGDAGYAGRVLAVMESRILMAAEAAEAEAAAARQTLH